MNGGTGGPYRYEGGGGKGTPEEALNIIGELEASAPMYNCGDVGVSPFASKPVFLFLFLFFYFSESISFFSFVKGTFIHGLFQFCC